MIPVATKDILTMKAAPPTKDVSAALPQTASPEMHFSLEFGLRGPTSVARKDRWANAVQQDATGIDNDVEVASNSTAQRIHAFSQAPNSTTDQANDLVHHEWDVFTAKPNSDDTSSQDRAAQIPLVYSFATLSTRTDESDVAIATAAKTHLLSQMPPNDPVQKAFPRSNVEATTPPPNSPASTYSSLPAAGEWPAEGKTTRNNQATEQQNKLETVPPVTQQAGKALTSLDAVQAAEREPQKTPTGDLSDAQASVKGPKSITADRQSATHTPLEAPPTHADSAPSGKDSASGARLEQSVSQNQVLSSVLEPAFQGLSENSLGVTGKRMVAMSEQAPVASLTNSPAAKLSTQASEAAQRTVSLQYDTRSVVAHAATIRTDSNGTNANAPQALGAQLLSAQSAVSTTTQPAPLQAAGPQSSVDPDLAMTSMPVHVSAIGKVASGPMSALILGTQSGPEAVEPSMLEAALSRDVSVVDETRSNARLDRLATSSAQASDSNSQTSAATPQSASAMLYSIPQAALNIAAHIQDDEAGFAPGEDVSFGAAVAAHASTAARSEVTANIGSTVLTVAQSVSRQITAAVVQMADQPVEIALSPEELGKVRLVLHASEHGMVVTVHAERPETLDLMRRNIGLLATDMRDLGYSELSFNFNDHPQHHSGQAGSKATTQGPNRDENRNIDTAVPILSPPKTPNDVTASGLDLRI